MKNKDFFNIWLPKWPAMVVVGRPVSRQQAMEIIIRTDDLSFGSNSPRFNKELEEYLYDVKIDTDGWDCIHDAIRVKLGILTDVKYSDAEYDYIDNKRSEVGQLKLEYLTNARIVSNWIGGAHGWCDWDGNIGCNTYNIGKRPTVEEVYNEWKLIAKAFPYLDLTCQLMNHESSCADMVDDPKPLINFVVKNGRVRMKEPDGYKRIPKSGVFTVDEQGCTIEQFKEAVDYCRNIFVTLQT
jgi:hypothetical protein